jgi:hypothetical protein
MDALPTTRTGGSLRGWRRFARNHCLEAQEPDEDSYNSFIATTSYLDRLLEPLTEAFTPKLASVLLGLRAD